MRATSSGSSPKFSSVRPKRGSVTTLISGERPREAPHARASAATAAATSPASDAFHDAPCAAPISKMVPPGAPEWLVSTTKVTGMPSRDSASAACWYARSAATRHATPHAGGGAEHSMPTEPIDVAAHDSRVQLKSVAEHS